MKKPKYLYESEIAVLKQELTATDYKALKFAEGELTAEEYAETKAQRESWRAEINRLQEELEKEYPEEETN